MTDTQETREQAVSKLRELVAKWPHDAFPSSGPATASYTRIMVHLEDCRRCKIEALLPALERRERELRERLDSARKVSMTLACGCAYPLLRSGKEVGSCVSCRLRAALNPTEPRT